MSPSIPQLAGVLPVFQTPFEEDESIDWTTLAKEIDWLLAEGCAWRGHGDGLGDLATLDRGATGYGRSRLSPGGWPRAVVISAGRRELPHGGSPGSTCRAMREQL